MLRMRTLLLVGCLALASVGVSAQSTTIATNYIRLSFASEKLTIGATVVPFTAATISPTGATTSNHQRASAASCSLETGDIRILTNGTPTASTGVYITAGTVFTLYGYTDLAAFKAIRVTSTSGTLNCIYYR